MRMEASRRQARREDGIDRRLLEPETSLRPAQAQAAGLPRARHMRLLLKKLDYAMKRLRGD